MRICWQLGQCTVREVLEEGLKTHKRDYRIILMFKTRMAKKGWLDVEKRGNVNWYSPELRGWQPSRRKLFDSSMAW